MSPHQTDLAFGVVGDGNWLRCWAVIKKKLRGLNCNMGGWKFGGVWGVVKFGFHFRCWINVEILLQKTAWIEERCGIVNVLFWKLKKVRWSVMWCHIHDYEVRVFDLTLRCQNVCMMDKHTPPGLAMLRYHPVLICVHPVRHSVCQEDNRWALVADSFCRYLGAWSLKRLASTALSDRCQSNPETVVPLMKQAQLYTINQNQKADKQIEW